MGSGIEKASAAAMILQIPPRGPPLDDSLLVARPDCEDQRDHMRIRMILAGHTKTREGLDDDDDNDDGHCERVYRTVVLVVAPRSGWNCRRPPNRNQSPNQRHKGKPRNNNNNKETLKKMAVSSWLTLMVFCVCRFVWNLPQMVCGCPGAI